MGINQKPADEVLSLRRRLNAVQIEIAKLEERKAAALKATKTAKDKLQELGFEPKTTDKELKKLKQKIEEQLSELEDVLGL